MNSRIIMATGCESSGKTTLAYDLSQALALPLVPEIARDYLIGRMEAEPGFRYQREDVLEIARRQHALEQCMLEDSPEGIVCDTGLLVPLVWSEVRYGDCDPWIRETVLEQVRQGPPRHYFLCDWRIPWEPDPLRENPHDRDALFARYEEKLQAYGMHYTLVSGSRSERLEQALQVLSGDPPLVKQAHM